MTNPASLQNRQQDSQDVYGGMDIYIEGKELHILVPGFFVWNLSDAGERLATL